MDITQMLLDAVFLIGGIALGYIFGKRTINLKREAAINERNSELAEEVVKLRKEVKKLKEKDTEEKEEVIEAVEPEEFTDDLEDTPPLDAPEEVKDGEDK